jgi:hypothetical protein
MWWWGCRGLRQRHSAGNVQIAIFLGLAVMQVCGDQVPGAPSDDSKRVLYLYYLGGSVGNRVSGYSAAAGIGIQRKG